MLPGDERKFPARGLLPAETVTVGLFISPIFTLENLKAEFVVSV